MIEGMPADDMTSDYSFIDFENVDDAFPYWEDDIDMGLLYLDLWDRIVRGLPIHGNAIEEEE